MKSISVVIPNYNGQHLLKENLPSVIAALNKAMVSNYELIVADDCSTDDSVLFLTNNYPQAVILKSDSNGGFSKNINKGLKVAKNELILILNTDVQLDEHFVSICLPYFEKEQTFGVMGAINGAGQNIYKISLGGIVSAKKEGVSASSSGIPLLVMSGGCSLVDNKKLTYLNWFDENFSPFYGEDDDLGIRAGRNQWKFYFDGNAKCSHAAASTITSYHKRRFIKTIAKRNKIYLHFVHLSSGRLIIFLVLQIAKLFISWLPGKLWYYKSFYLFASNMKKAVAQRKLNQQLPLSLEELISETKKGQINI